MLPEGVLSIVFTADFSAFVMDANSFTYVSDCHRTTSWLDRVPVNHSLFNAISGMAVEYDYVSSDHRPLKFDFIAKVEQSGGVLAWLSVWSKVQTGMLLG